MSEQNCGNCYFSIVNVDGNGKSCRKNAPILTATYQDSRWFRGPRWPQVIDALWCGEWRSNEPEPATSLPE